MFDKLNGLLEQFTTMGIPAWDCIVYHKGREVFRRMYGFSDYEKTTPIDGTERYNIYSCSKPITVTAALMLWQQGKLGLDDLLADYLPEFGEMTVRENGGVRPAKTAITIRQLFTMTAGFDYNLNSPSLKQCREETENRCPTREAMRYLAKEPLLFDPGETFAYSLCHDVLAAVVEVVSGMTFGDFVKTNIFDPCGMKDSTFRPTAEEVEGLAAQYVYGADKKEFRNCGKACGYRIGSEYESGGAGCVSTVNDYIRFLEALRAGKLMSEETLDLLASDQLTEGQKRTYGMIGDGYSYGLGVRCPLAGSPATDFGWGGAAGAYLVIDRKHEATLYYAQHVLAQPNAAMRNLLPAALREIAAL